MPLTFPAHQAVVLPLKTWRPGSFDGVALCVGAAAPDLGYAFGPWLAQRTNGVIGVLVFSVPFTAFVATVLRARAAAGIFAHVPDLGSLRLRSYAVIGTRWPSASSTLVSAVIGASTHVVIDAFTHDGWWGADLLGLDRTVAEGSALGAVSIADLLQIAGHVLGTVVAFGVLSSIGSQRLLEQWYGEAAVRTARAEPFVMTRALVFWLAVMVPTLVVGVVRVLTERPAVFPVLTTGVLAALAMGVVAGSFRAPTRP